MPPSESHVEHLLAEKRYEVAELGDDMLRMRDVETGGSFRAAPEGNALHVSVALETVQAGITIFRAA